MVSASCSIPASAEGVFQQVPTFSLALSLIMCWALSPACASEFSRATCNRPKGWASGSEGADCSRHLPLEVVGRVREAGSRWSLQLDARHALDKGRAAVRMSLEGTASGWAFAQPQDLQSRARDPGSWDRSSPQQPAGRPALPPRPSHPGSLGIYINLETLSLAGVGGSAYF